MSIGCITIMSMNSCLQSLDLLNTSHHAPSNVDTLMAELDSYTVNKKMFLDSEQKTRVYRWQLGRSSAAFNLCICVFAGCFSPRLQLHFSTVLVQAVRPVTC